MCVMVREGLEAPQIPSFVFVEALDMQLYFYVCHRLEALEEPYIPPIHCKYNGILTFVFVSDAPEEPYIHPVHCKYNGLMTLVITSEGSEDSEVPRMHCKYKGILMFVIVSKFRRSHKHFQCIANTTAYRCFS
jgi:hypothetical protein